MASTAMGMFTICTMMLNASTRADYSSKKTGDNMIGYLTLEPCEHLSEAIRSRHESLRGHFPKLDKSYFSNLVKTPETRLKIKEKGRRCFLDDTGSSYSNLYESSCSSHDRFAPDNIRIKMEDLMVDYVVKRLLPKAPAKILSLISMLCYYIAKWCISDIPVRILCIHPDGCLQELMLVARLAEEGAEYIQLVLVDPEYTCAESYLDLVYFLKKIKEAYGIRLDCQVLESVDGVKSANEPVFDIVYAISYDYYYPYLINPHLICDEERFTTKRYLAAIELMNAATLAKNELDPPLIIMSKDGNIISLAHRTAKSSFPEFRSLSELTHDLCLVDSFYLNSDVSNLIINLEYFISLNKPLLINTAIIQEDHMSVVANFLDRYNITCRFIDDDDAVRKFQNNPRSKFAILDYTIFHPKNSMTSVSKAYLEPNLYVVRLDLVKAFSEIKMDVDVPRPLLRE
jgi:hypothetical protein